MYVVTALVFSGVHMERNAMSMVSLECRMRLRVGSGFLFANSAAIITDAFPANQRGFAMVINQIAAILGSVIGLILGGILSYFSWRLVFLVSVPVGVVGTIWAYLMLRETATIRA